MGEWIAIASLALTVGGVIAGFISKFSKMELRIEKNEERDKEEREKNDKKFDELYQASHKNNENLVELNTTIKMLVTNLNTQYERFDKRFTSIESKLDELSKKSRTTTRK